MASSASSSSVDRRAARAAGGLPYSSRSLHQLARAAPPRRAAPSGSCSNCSAPAEARLEGVERRRRCRTAGCAPRAPRPRPASPWPTSSPRAARASCSSHQRVTSRATTSTRARRRPPATRLAETSHVRPLARVPGRCWRAPPWLDTPGSRRRRASPTARRAERVHGRRCGPRRRPPACCAAARFRRAHAAGRVQQHHRRLDRLEGALPLGGGILERALQPGAFGLALHAIGDVAKHHHARRPLAEREPVARDLDVEQRAILLALLPRLRRRVVGGQQRDALAQLGSGVGGPTSRSETFSDRNSSRWQPYSSSAASLTARNDSECDVEHEHRLRVVLEQEAVAFLGVLERALGQLAVGHVAHHHDHARDLAVLAASRRVGRRGPARLAGHARGVGDVGRAGQFARERALEQPLQPLLDQLREDLGERAADHLRGGHVGELLHERVPQLVAQLAVVGDVPSPALGTSSSVERVACARSLSARCFRASSASARSRSPSSRKASIASPTLISSNRSKSSAQVAPRRPARGGRRARPRPRARVVAAAGRRRPGTPPPCSVGPGWAPPSRSRAAGTALARYAAPINSGEGPRSPAAPPPGRRPPTAAAARAPAAATPRAASRSRRRRAPASSGGGSRPGSEQQQRETWRLVRRAARAESEGCRGPAGTVPASAR